MQTIKLVKELSGFSLSEAKELVDGLPRALAAHLPESVARKYLQKFQKIGAEVKLVLNP